MKRSLLTLLLLSSALLSPAIQQEPKVYVTESGKKYHRANCIFLKKSRREMMLAEAKKAGHKACKVCQPPQ